MKNLMSVIGTMAVVGSMGYSAYSIYNNMNPKAKNKIKKTTANMMSSMQ